MAGRLGWGLGEEEGAEGGFGRREGVVRVWELGAKVGASGVRK